MPIVTLAQTKTLLGITGSAQDSIISTMIPVVQERVVQITANYFLSSDIYTQAGTVFSGATLTASAVTSFLTDGFAVDDEIYIYNSYRNDDWYEIHSITTNVITIASTYSDIGAAGSKTVTSEVSGASVLISLVKWPVGLRAVVANMVKYDVDVRPKLKGLQMQRIGPTTEMYQIGRGVFGYPEDILGGLAPWMQADIL